MSLRVRLLTALLPILFLAAYLLVKLLDRDFARLLVYESGWFEWFQFWCFLAAAVMSSYAAWQLIRKSRRRAGSLIGCLSMALFFIALEEINWGQWILDIPLPAYFERNNSQNNLTLHNLNFFQPHLHLSTILGCTVITIGILVAPSMKFPLEARALLPDRVLTFYVAPLALFYLFTDYLSPWLVAKGWDVMRVGFDHRKSFIIFSDQEAVECVFALGVCIYTLSLTRAKSSP